MKNSNSPNMKSIISALLERDENGRVLPTKRNGSLIAKVVEKHGKNLDAAIEEIGRDTFIGYTTAVTFDPRSANVFFSKPEQALNAIKRSQIINEYDMRYLDEVKYRKN